MHIKFIGSFHCKVESFVIKPKLCSVLGMWNHVVITEAGAASCSVITGDVTQPSFAAQWS